MLIKRDLLRSEREPLKMDIREAIKLVVDGGNLSEDEMRAVMDDIMSGETTPAQIGSFLTGLRMKGETVEEITGAAKVMREKATRIDAGIDMTGGGIVVDTCGTGGDGSGTFNVSTTSSFVVCGCGCTVAKHGNRSVSSFCGSADVLEAVGVNLDLDAGQIGECLKKIGIGFLFAPALHGAMKYAIGPRREIGMRTIFNILGPLTNPAEANVQVLGVFARDLIVPMANVLKNMGSLRALVVHGEGNLDELTITGETAIAELRERNVTTYTITPESVGLKRATIDELKGGKDKNDAAVLMKEVLSGASGPRRDMTLLNSGAALMVAGKAERLVDGIELAAACIDDGRALKKLEELITLSNNL